MTKVLSVVTHNLSDHGMPTLTGDVILTQETNRRGLQEHYTAYEHFFPKRAPQLAISWNPRVYDVQRTKVHRLHRSGRSMDLDNFSPTRFVIWTEGDWDGMKLAVLDTHLINSAWAPLWKQVTHRDVRRALWQTSATEIRQVVRGLRKRDFEVVLGGDMNRLQEKFSQRMGLEKQADGTHNGLDRIFHTPGLRAVNSDLGRKTGSADVTHHSVRVAFEKAGGGDKNG